MTRPRVGSFVGSNRWLLWLIASSAAACGSRVSVGDLGGSGAGSGGTSLGVGGSSVAGGGSGGGGASTSPPVVVCPNSLDQPLSLPASCPSAIPSNGDSCEDALENAICVWQVDLGPKGHGYHAAGCYSGIKGKIWWGVDASKGEPFAAEDASCPNQAPHLGETCPGQATVTTCIYPTQYCECGPIDPGQWLCTEQLAGHTSPPVPVQRLCAPAGIDETKQVKALTSQEALAWCNWYGDPSAGARHAISGQDSRGVADSYPYQVLSTPEMPVCLADLPAALCAQNLTTAPCSATLAELDDCVETIRAAPTGWVGHGCAPLLANPSCAGIIVQPYTSQGKVSQCVVPLEKQ